jgi:hypothetical protein
MIAACALFKLYRLSRLPGSSAPVVTKQALHEIFEQILFEIEAEHADEEGLNVEPT